MLNTIAFTYFLECKFFTGKSADTHIFLHITSLYLYNYFSPAVFLGIIICRNFAQLLSPPEFSVSVLNKVFIVPLIYGRVSEQPYIFSHPSRKGRFFSINNSPLMACPNAYMNKSLSYSHLGSKPVQEHT